MTRAEDPAAVNGQRRRALATVFWSAVAVASAAIAAPLATYFATPLLRRRKLPRVRVLAVAELPPGEPQRVEFMLRRRDGWITETARRTAWVVRQADGGVTVFDPRCTHLGCAYHWHAASRQFLCPCHNGLYDIEGRVVGGPPPRPLDTYATAVEDGVLYVVPVPRQVS